MAEETKRDLQKEIKEGPVVERIITAFNNGKDRVERYLESITDDPDEKIVADIVLDFIEEISGAPFTPLVLDKMIHLAIMRLRKRFNIPDND